MIRRAKVSILGAGNVGSTLARQIAESRIAEVILWNRSRKSCGIALDLIQSGADSIIGTHDYRDTAHSDIIVVTTGMTRHPGMSRDELVTINAEIVAEVIQNAVVYSPDALLLVVTNPVDAMSYIGWHVSGLSSRRVMGISGTLDTSRFKSFIAQTLNISKAEIQAMVIGAHNDRMIPLPRYCSVHGIPLYDLMDIETVNEIVEQTRHCGAEIISLMQKSAYFAPAKAIYEVIEAILCEQSKILPISAYLTNGEYNLYDVFLGTPCRIGRNGVEQIIELKLTKAELALLRQSANLVRQSFNFYLQHV